MGPYYIDLLTFVEDNRKVSIFEHVEVLSEALVNHYINRLAFQSKCEACTYC
jgi:hypothetical protein